MRATATAAETQRRREETDDVRNEKCARPRISAIASTTVRDMTDPRFRSPR